MRVYTVCNESNEILICFVTIIIIFEGNIFRSNVNTFRGNSFRAHTIAQRANTYSHR